MTIPQPANTEPNNNRLDFIVRGAPNDNTDGRDCVCGHAKTAHTPLNKPDDSQQAWQCLYCICTRAYPAVPSHP